MIKYGNKYKESKKYHLVYKHLLSAAQYHGIVMYQEVAKIMGLPSQGSYMSSEVGQMLGEISTNEHKNGRPMLIAIVIGKGNEMPGTGFFELARNLKKLMSKDREEEKKFWERECNSVYAEWKK